MAGSAGRSEELIVPLPPVTSVDMASQSCTADPSCVRPKVRGKYFFVADQKIYLRGVSFGPLASRAGCELGTPEVVAADFKIMKALNINCVRTYGVPDQWFLDLSGEHGLRVLVGIPWSQHVAFLDDSHLPKEIERTITASIRRNLGHRSILGYLIGSEIPASIVRWHGPRNVERFLHRLYLAAKTVDPDALVSYANYPTTEYLDARFLDFVSFNVYLEDRNALQRYLYRLQNIAGEMPLLITEFGLDTARNGEALQAEVLGWQIEDLFAAGCAGGFIFSWTDEWHRGGERVEDWDFGITTRDRHPKKAAQVVNSAFADAPFGGNRVWPSVSVVVCVHNGQATIRRCLQALAALNYPDYEVIVIDDGSRDGTAKIVEEFSLKPRFRLFRTENRGLSSARNLGIQYAAGEIMAFLDSDAYPDREWLRYFAIEFMRSDYSALGGPNIPSPDTNGVSHCVAASPGWPTHVLVSDRDAEHIPGCNMAFRRKVLESIGGFDPQFRTAGDDVDICWRIAASGYRIGFCPGALVWHLPRSTIRAYWNQQKGYGSAEALLEQKWPEKYHGPGQIIWAGRIYNGHPYRTGNWRIYHGILGMSPFQSIYSPKPGESGLSVLAPLHSWLTSSEWNVAAGLLILLSLLSPLWPPLLVCVFLLSLRITYQVSQAISAACASNCRKALRPDRTQWTFTLITALLHLMQPVARMVGRSRRAFHKLFAFQASVSLPYCRTMTIWNEKWQPPAELLHELESRFSRCKATVLQGKGFDRWDLQIKTGVAGAVRIRMAHEEHEKGKQLIRIRCWPHWSRCLFLLISCTSFLSVLAAIDNCFAASLALGSTGAAAAIRGVLDSASATDLLLKTVESNLKREL